MSEGQNQDPEKGRDSGSEKHEDDSHDSHDNDDTNDQPKRLPFKEWVVQRVDWSWFTCTQSTGGIATLLSECPKQFNGLKTIGTIFFILNMTLWLTFFSLLITRWVLKPGSFKRSIYHPPESYFIGSFWLTVASFIMCMSNYGVPHTGPWLIVAIRVCFWIFAACTFLSTSAQETAIFHRKPARAIDMTPAWLLSVFQAMLTGTIAASIAQQQPPEQRLPIIIAGVTYQGFGWCAAFLILAWYYGSMVEHGWPAASQTPALFLTVGSIGYTIAALIGNARAVPDGYAYFAAHPQAPEILRVMALFVGIFLWLFGFWLFAIALYIVCAHIFGHEDGRLTFPTSYANAFWSIIFPNVGFTLGTIYIGQELESNAIQWVSVAMVILLVCAWIMNATLMAKTIYRSLFVDSRIKLN